MVASGSGEGCEENADCEADGDNRSEHRTGLGQKSRDHRYADGVIYTEQYADSSSYTGTFRQNLREGVGRLSYRDGDVYSGEFVRDMRHGRGLVAYANGDSYEGAMVKDKPEGQGTFHWKDGREYRGLFSQGAIHGQGSIKYVEANFPIDLLVSACRCGPENSARGRLNEVPGSVRALTDATRSRGRYVGDFQDGRRHGSGRVEFRAACDSGGLGLEPHFLQGEWVDDQWHGQGVLHVEGHLRYDGALRFGEACGEGKLVRHFQGGLSDTFEGSFERGAVHGFASYVGPDGALYSGQFQDGLRHGQGEVTIRGTVYRGDFHLGKRKGAGRYASATANYDGAYCDGFRHGFGTLKQEDAAGRVHRYDGELVRSLRHGEGALHSEDCEYSGSWLRNVRHGYGKQTWRHTGNEYAGQWADDAMHGHGRLETRAMRYTGHFISGEQEGQGLQVWKNEGLDQYEGEFLASRPHGRGTFTFPLKGESYVGGVAYGLMSGEGEYRYADGSRYSGQWRSGRQNGKGELSYADNTVYRGEFVDDTFHGEGLFAEADGSVYTGRLDHDRRVDVGTTVKGDGKREVRRYSKSGRLDQCKPALNFAGAVVATLPEAKLPVLPLLSPRRPLQTAALFRVRPAYTTGRRVRQADVSLGALPCTA